MPLSIRTGFVLSAALALGFSLALAFVPAAAQEDQGIVTPTLAPSKTAPPPTATASVESSAVTAQTGARSQLTQADLAVLTGNVQRPNGIVWHDGNLYTACTGDWTVYELDAMTGQTATYIWGVRNAHSLYAETGDSGELNLWVPDFQENTFNRVTRNGVDPVVSGMNGPWGVAFLDRENFFVSNLRGDSVSLIQRSGAMRDVIVDLASPTGLARDQVYLYVANNGSTRRSIEWYDIRALISDSAPQGIEPQPLVTGLQNTTGLTLAEDGSLYFAYSLGNRGVVGRVDPAACRENGGCTADQVEIVVLTELAAPLAGLTVSPEMRLYIHTMFSPDIYWVQL